VRAFVAAALLVAALTGCTAPYDDDGELVLPGSLAAAQAPDEDATPIVVDTDLGGDDLVALALLLRRPDVQIEAVTIAGTGLVGCADGPDLVADLVHALGESPMPVACGREDAARPMPPAWRELAASGTGLPRRDTTFLPVSEPAPRLIGRLAGSVDGLRVVALGPLTNLADLARERPEEYARLAGVTAMLGALEAPAVDGVAEWNAAADPAAAAVVLAASVPLTVVPDDAVPDGSPSALAAPVVGAVAAVAGISKWWDLATAAAFVAPAAAVPERGAWAVDDSGRLTRTGAGPVRVLRSLDEAVLDGVYEEAFGSAAPG
jgi:hypothetical protein